MHRSLRTYLRTHRRRAGLTQTELAFLLGTPAESVSRLERQCRRPNVELSFACEVIFNVASRELFPGLRREVEQTITERARRLYRYLEARDQSRRTERKLELLRVLAFPEPAASADDV